MDAERSPLLESLNHRHHKLGPHERFYHDGLATIRADESPVIRARFSMKMIARTEGAPFSEQIAR